MKVTVSRWENDHQVPDDFYRPLLCRVLKVEESDLGLAAAIARSPMMALTPRLISTDMVRFFEDVLQQYIRADHLLGPGQVLGAAVEHMSRLESLCRDARGDVRHQLLHLSVRYAEFLGWLCQDSADLPAADRWTARAGDLAQLVADPNLTSYVAMRRAGILADSGRHADSLSFAELAGRTPSVTPRVHALAQRQLAMTNARLGDDTACRRAADAALEAVAQPDDGAFGPASYCSPAFVAMEAGTSLAVLGALELAAEHLAEAVVQWPDGQQRDRGLCTARLADVYASAGHLESACEAADVAADLLAVAPSARTAQTLRIVRSRLHPHRRHDAVRQVTAKLADVI